MRTKLIPILACLLPVMFQQCSTNKPAEEFIQQPFSNIDVEGNTFELDASEERTFRLANGSSIVVPANIFVDENNNPIKGKVKIDYREFHDAADIIASGIPMNYDSAGIKGNFETAGMFEIEGTTADNKPVFIAQGRSLQVNIASFNKGNDFNFYYFDPNTGAWTYRGAAPAKENAEKKAKVEALGEPPVKPITPEKYDGKSAVFDLDLNYKQYPELKEFNGVVWQYSGNDPNADPAKNPEIFRQHWTSVRLNPTDGETSEFNLVLSNSSKTFTTQVKPVLKGKNYEKAMAKFQERIEKYKAAYAARLKEEDRLRSEADFIRSFQVSGFGLYNCDKYYGRPDVVTIAASFVIEGAQGNTENIRIYHITGGDKAVIPYSQHSSNFSFSPNDDNKLLAVLPGNKLAALSAGEFDNIDTEELGSNPQSSYTFRLKPTSKDVTTVTDLRTVLEGL